MAAYDYAYMALYHHKSFHAFTYHKSTIQEMGTRIAWCLLFWVYTCSLSLGSLKHTLYRTCRWRGAQPQPSIMADLSKPRLGYSMRLFTYTSEVYFESSILKREAKRKKPALHREITRNLKTDAYLMTMQRIVIGGRDQPKFDRKTE